MNTKLAQVKATVQVGSWLEHRPEHDKPGQASSLRRIVRFDDDFVYVEGKTKTIGLHWKSLAQSSYTIHAPDAGCARCLKLTPCSCVAIETHRLAGEDGVVTFIDVTHITACRLVLQMAYSTLTTTPSWVKERLMASIQAMKQLGEEVEFAYAASESAKSTGETP